MTTNGNKTGNPSSTADAPNDVSRRTVLRGATLAGGAAILATAMTTQQAEAKMTQQAAGYVPVSKTSKHCADCQLFEAPSSCRLIGGVISPKGYCRFYVKKG